MISESPATPRYPKYRSAGIEWLEEIPSHWDVSPLFLVSKENDARNHQQVESNVLSLSYGRIVRRDVSLHHGLLPESFETYQVLQPGDIVLRLTDLQNDKRSLRVGLVPEPGIITSAYVGLSLRDSLESRFAYYLLHSYDVTKVFYRLGGGVRQTMKFADLRRLPIVLPPAQEQHAIADFLDRETAKIDGLVASKERLIELLQEKRTALITRAVTRGLDPNVPMKDSGVEWLGKVPGRWVPSKVKYLADYLNGYAFKPSDWSSDGLPIVRIKNLTDPSTAVNRYSGTLRDRFQVTRGDILISWSASLGAHIWMDEEDAWLNQHIFKVALRESVVSRPFYIWLARWFIGEMAKDAHGSTMQHLTREAFGGFRLALPPREEQEAIATFLDHQSAKIDALLAKVHQAIEHLKEFRTALISAAVTGKIDVRGQAA